MTMIWETAGALARGVWRKTSAWRRSSMLMPGRRSLHISPQSVQAVSLVQESAVTGGTREATARPAASVQGKEGELVKRISRETAIWNRNNITRTQAYWNLYQCYPELHWALLAHMVSRNGGWYMTDLKGEWLPHLLPPETAETYYDVLETSNALIFRDVYPQLRIYTESRKAGRPLFHLHSTFQISAFMQPIWERFWACPQTDCTLLAVALIVHEQNLIEQPVIQNPQFRDQVLTSSVFKALPLLQTNQIVFPMLRPAGHRKRHLPLVGRVMERFADLDERIATGKCLYGMLFGYPLVRQGVMAFAGNHPHTGSRADYWPHRFRAKAPKAADTVRGADGAADHRWYSPAWAAAWQDRPLPDGPVQDWYAGADRDRVQAWLASPKPPRIFDMTSEHLLCQHKLQALTLLTRRRGE